MQISVSRERNEESSPKSNDTHDVVDEFHRKGQVDHSGTNPDMDNISAQVKVMTQILSLFRLCNVVFVRKFSQPNLTAC